VFKYQHVSICERRCTLVTIEDTLLGDVSVSDRVMSKFVACFMRIQPGHILSDPPRTMQKILNNRVPLTDEWYLNAPARVVFKIVACALQDVRQMPVLDPHARERMAQRFKIRDRVQQDRTALLDVINGKPLSKNEAILFGIVKRKEQSVIEANGRIYMLDDRMHVSTVIRADLERARRHQIKSARGLKRKSRR